MVFVLSFCVLMPFYEYRCSACGHSLTKLQSMSAPALTTCPECHQETLVKLISASNCELKGVGVFGSSKQPFKNETPTPTCPGASAASSGKDSAGSASPCASCPAAAAAN